MPMGKPFSGDAWMTCEEFASAALDLDVAPEGPVQQAAREHMRNCPHCAALHENWLALRADLRLLGHETSDLEAGARVEMRLRQEFRIKHKTMKTRRAAVAATWALAAAAVLLVAVSWLRWNQNHNLSAGRQSTPTVTSPMHGQTVPNTTAADLGATVVASNDSNEFTLLPGSVPSAAEGATVVHVEMQRAALGALGLTVNEERAGDLIQVDLLIGDDGLPEAVRLPKSSN
jgi:predicted anti-sigma-YlaC factor YlaD